MPSDLKSVEVDFKAYGSTSLSVSGQYVISQEGGEQDRFNIQAYFDPLIGTFSGKVKAEGYTMFDNSISDLREDSNLSKPMISSQTAKLVQGTILIISPFLFVICIIGYMKTSQGIHVLLDDFNSGLFEVSEISCTATQVSSTAPSFCYAQGHIIEDNVTTDLVTTLKLGYKHEVDFDKKVYSVFFRKNGRFAIINNDNKTTIDKTEYFIQVAFSFFAPIISLTVAVLLYYNIENYIET